MKLLVLASALLSSVVIAEQTCSHSLDDSRWQINSDGTVLDSHTALMWQRCPVGQTLNAKQCAGELSRLTWFAALEHAQTNDFAGHSNWRLPDIKELFSIAELDCTAPSFNQTAFPSNALDSNLNKLANVWSATILPQEALTHAYKVDLANANVAFWNREEANTVWLVRTVVE